MSNTTNENYIQKLYEDLYEKHYQELSPFSDDVEWIENEASKLAEIELDNYLDDVEWIENETSKLAEIDLDNYLDNFEMEG